MKKKSIIEVDGQHYQAQYIGRGQYSKVYRVGDRVVMYTRGDCAKEVLAMYQYDRMAHLPEIIRHKNVTKYIGHIWYVFSSPYYQNVTKKDKSAWELMTKMIKYYKTWYNFYYRQGHRGWYLMSAFVDGMDDDGEFPNSVIRAMKELVTVSGNCGHNVGFDLKKNNFGVNEYGTLIFRDLVYVQ